MRRILIVGILSCLAAFGFAQEKKVEKGIASFYSGYKYVANYPERFNPDSMTAAHKSLPFGSIIRVENVVNGKSVNVRVNNRGPFIKKRIVDLTPAAFKKIAPLKKGIVKVTLEVVSLGKKK